MWPTPTTQDAKNDGGPSQWERNSDPLNVAVKRWATPSRADAQGSHGGGQGRSLRTDLWNLKREAERWPTPKAEDSQSNGAHPGRTKPDTLTSAVRAKRRWSTPTVQDARENVPDGLRPSRIKSGRRTDYLSREVKMWPTPTAGDAAGGRTTSKGKDFPTSLNAAVRGLKWPTPTTNDFKHPGQPRDPNTASAKGLAARTKWPTPTTARGDYQRDHGTKGKERPTLSGAAKLSRDPSPSLFDDFGPQDQPNPSTTGSLRGSLNPDWEEALMGWPIGWTASRPLAMDRYQSWRRLLLWFLHSV